MIERAYNVPLRREFLKVPRYKRAKTAVNALKRFLHKHMKSEEIFIGKRLNEQIWENGMRNPPHHVSIGVVKEDDGKVYAELSGFKYEKPLTEEETKKAEKEKTEFKKGETKIKEELKELEQKTEKIKEEKARKGEEKEKKIEKLEKKEELEEKKIKPGEKIPGRQDKKRKENIHG